MRFPKDVSGWLTRCEGEALYELARAKDVLEIGSYQGKSTICLAQSARAVLSVDPHDGRATPRPRPTKQAMQVNLRRYNVDGKVAHAWPFPENGESFDLVFIDGDHSYEAVKADIETAKRVLRPGGVIACHDYNNVIEGVTEAVDEEPGEKETAGALVWWKP